MRITEIRPSNRDGENRKRPDIAAELQRRVIGQEEAISAISPYVEIFFSGLAPQGRPSGVFLLLGPTGTGKTHTVEALAEVLHGSAANLVRIDCGEYQMEHEVAKLIGAPPGYLGHRETQPVITQQKLAAATSERCPLSIVLFDEVEKAAASLTRILLGVLDKASMRLGDGTTVNFERSMIFMTSNSGAREMAKARSGGFGFARNLGGAEQTNSSRVEAVGLAALRRRFAPEFINRIDRSVVYQPLSQSSIADILDRQIDALERHIAARLGPRAFEFEISTEARDFLIREGACGAMGARELKRTLHRRLLHPLARLILAGGIPPGAYVRVEKARGGGLAIRPRLPRRIAS
jgi:ATP-dependent Clp protease ATP-binding subunit ClpA